METTNKTRKKPFRFIYQDAIFEDIHNDVFASNIEINQYEANFHLGKFIENDFSETGVFFNRNDIEDKHEYIRLHNYIKKEKMELSNFICKLMLVYTSISIFLSPVKIDQSKIDSFKLNQISKGNYEGMAIITRRPHGFRMLMIKDCGFLIKFKLNYDLINDRVNYKEIVKYLNKVRNLISLFDVNINIYCRENNLPYYNIAKEKFNSINLTDYDI